MITTAAWVPRGFAAPFPTKYNFDEKEFERIAELAKLQLDDANDDLEEARGNEGESSQAKGQGKSSEKNDPSAEAGESNEYVSST